MERLTERKSVMLDGRKIREHASELYWRLKHYEDLEEQGLLLKLPCKVGDTVYAFDYPRTDIVVVVEEVVEKVLIWKLGIEIETDGGCYDLEFLGKKLFLTKEEAEAKLKEFEGEP